jgi:hypothetical protein
MSKSQDGSSAPPCTSLLTLLLLLRVMWNVFCRLAVVILWSRMRKKFKETARNKLRFTSVLSTILINPAETQPSFYLHRLLSMSVLRSAALFRTSAVSVWLFIGAVRRWLLGRISESRRWHWWSHPLDTSWGGDQASSDSSFVRMTDNLSVADFGTTVVHCTHCEDKTQTDQTSCSEGLRVET